jgi:microcystin degradation protein MlrC
MARIVRGGVRPVSALVKLPLLAGLQRQYTHAEPMLGIKHLARDLENGSGILNVSYLPGFPWADIPFTSFSVIVTAEGDQQQAHRVACQLAQEIWNRREQFAVQPVPVDEAVRRAIAARGGPVVLADIGDNPGGGAPADGTVLLEALLRHGAKRAALAVIRDPEVVEQARQAGEGAELQLTLGGKTDDRHGRPLLVRGRVVRLSDGRFTHTGPMSTGMMVDLGPTAVLELEGQQGGQVLVVVTTYRYQPTDLGVFRRQGIEPTAQQILAVKSSVHFRAAFGPIAHEVIEVDTPGITNPRLDPDSYHKLSRPIYPFDRDLDWRIDV